MSIVDRVKNICLSPSTEWPVIAAEPATAGGIVSGHAAPLIGISVVASLIGSTLLLGALGGFSAGFGLISAVVMFVLQICFLFILSFIIDFLAPTFGGQKNGVQAMKAAAYSMTPAWVAGIAQIVPFLGGLIAFLGALYGIYVLYLGLPSTMKAPQDKSVAYTVVVVVVAMVIGFILSMMLFAFGLAGALGAGAMGSALGANSESSDTFASDSPLGKLEDLGKALEQSNKEMEAAQKSGDANAATAAAFNTLGTLFGGGKKVEPLDTDQLKGFIPDSFAGLARQGDIEAEKTGMAGMSVSRVEMNYGDGAQKRVTLEITDSGSMSGLMGLASWAAVQGNKEDASGSERTGRVGGRMTHERDSKTGTDEYAVVVGERFMVTAKSDDVELSALKGAVGSLDLSKLESMKDVGVQKP